jgi:signal transduction histidine kinase
MARVLPVTRRTLQLAAAVAVVPMAGSAVWLALTSDHLAHPTASALYTAYLIAAPMLIGLTWWRRRPASRFGPLLIIFGLIAWVYSWQSSDRALLFDLGVLADAPAFWLTFYLFVAFPMGRAEPPAARWLMFAAALVIVAFFLPWVLLSPVIAGGGALAGCVAACPDNLLQVGAAPKLVERLGTAETYSMLGVALGILVVYAARLRTATRPQRRSLIAVAATSLLFVPVFLTFHVERLVIKASPDTVETLGWALIGARVLLPLGFLAALWQADFFAGAASRRLIAALAARPSRAQWRDEVAAALDDPAFALGYREDASGHYLSGEGAELRTPDGPARSWVPINREGTPVAAMVIDSVLTEDPELVRAAASATLLAIEHGHVEGELEAERGERRRLERDLHDGAQQRLLALRIHLDLAGELLDRPEDRARLRQLGTEVDEALDDLRSLAHGIYPHALADGGVAAALAAATRDVIPINIENGLTRRHPRAVELTAYFCCLEALQNVAKHAGPQASATVQLAEDDHGLRFIVEDDGAGFDPHATDPGAGLANLAERLAAVRGSLEIDAAPGRGTRIVGRVPAGPPAERPSSALEA